jgi:hypothetical protein
MTVEAQFFDLLIKENLLMTFVFEIVHHCSMRFAFSPTPGAVAISPMHGISTITQWFLKLSGSDQ